MPPKPPKRAPEAEASARERILAQAERVKQVDLVAPGEMQAGEARPIRRRERLGELAVTADDEDAMASDHISAPSLARTLSDRVAHGDVSAEISPEMVTHCNKWCFSKKSGKIMKYSQYAGVQARPSGTVGWSKVALP